jgi:hypothetical protein
MCFYSVHFDKLYLCLYKQESVVGRIDSILAMESDNHAIVVLEMFQVSSERHPVWDMPTLVQRHSEISYLIIPSTVSLHNIRKMLILLLIVVQKINFIFNAQHDCREAKCEATGKRLQVQERVQSDISESYIEHKSLARFIINMTSLHNPHLLREALPRSLTAPVPLFTDRKAKHFQIAATLRTSQDSKRLEAAKKRARAKEVKQAAANGDRVGSSAKKRKVGSGADSQSSLGTMDIVEDG